MQSTLKPTGSVTVRLNRAGIQPAPLAWKLRNWLRPGFIVGWLAFHVVRPFANAFGLMTAIGELRIEVRQADGTRIDYGVVSYRVVTDAGVNYLVDDFDNASGGADVSLFNFHGVGTGTNSEAAGDTALQTESTTALNPDNTRATGTRSQPSANIFRSAGTNTFDASAAITEHGLFTSATVAAGTLWDRSVFSAINVISGDSLTSSYSVTFSSGG